MKITIDTDNLSELDINMLTFLAENGEVASDPAPEAAAAPVKAEKAAPKTEPKKATAKEEPKAEEVAPEEPAAEEDLLGGEDAPTMSDAVAAATALVSSGNAAKVKEALAAVGEVKRVSELKDAQIPTFLAALK